MTGEGPGPVSGRRRPVKEKAPTHSCRVPLAIGAGLLVIIVMLSAAFVSSNIVLRSARADVDGISVRIIDNLCNVSVALTVHAPIGSIDREVRAVHGNGSEVLTYERGRVSGPVAEEAFRSMLSDGKVTVKANYGMDVLGLFRVERGLSETFDISGIASSLRDLTVNNVTVVPTLKGYMIVRMDLRTTMDERLDITVERTAAKIRLSTGDHKVTVESLIVDGSKANGSCTLWVPTAAVLSIAFLDRSVSFDCYGISGTFVLPQ